MTVKLTSVVHVLAILPAVIALVMTALGTAPFTVSPIVPWALLLLGTVCTYVANTLSSIFAGSSSQPRAPPAPTAPAAA